MGVYYSTKVTGCLFLRLSESVPKDLVEQIWFYLTRQLFIGPKKVYEYIMERVLPPSEEKNSP